MSDLLRFFSKSGEQAKVFTVKKYDFFSKKFSIFYKKRLKVEIF